MQENLNKFLKVYNKLIDNYNFYPKPNFVNNNLKLGLYEKHKSLQIDGICQFTIDNKLIKKINEDISYKLEYLKNDILIKTKLKKKIKFKDISKLLDKHENKIVFEIIENFLNSSKIIQVIQEFLNCKVKVKDIFLQYNNHTITSHFYHELDNNFIPMRNKFEYMHIDSKIWPRVKLIVYLNDLNLDNGPFMYSKNTSKIIKLSEKLIRKTNDIIKLNNDEFKNLPFKFQKHTFFSRNLEDIKSNFNLLNLALENEIKLISPNGENNVILFDVDGIHRGGFVSKKSRKILQILFEKK